MSLLTDFFSIILKGESKTYNDHNYYVSGNKLKGYIEGSYGNKYPLLNKPLSEYTVGEVMQFQARSRDNTGQLWATGRYQIIPNTLKGLQQSMKLPLTAKYDNATQDAMGLKLLTERSAIRNYITSAIGDTKENLERAALEVSKIWSSVGVPFATQGRNQAVQKNQSYYSGGGDKASVTTEAIQEKLKMLRNGWGNVTANVTANIGGQKKNILIGILLSLAIIATYSLIKTLRNKN
jgi:hypothetical protein